MTRCAAIVLALTLAGCPGPAEPDAGACTVDVEVGVMEGDAFVALAEGDPVELLLGFQGFRMLRLAVRTHGRPADELEIGASLAVADTGVELDQRTRERGLAPTADGVLLEEYLLFVNDIPPAQIVGYEAELDLTVRGAGCLGGASARITIRDDDPCVDHGIVVDAATRPDAPDGGVVCE